MQLEIRMFFISTSNKLYFTNKIEKPYSFFFTLVARYIPIKKTLLHNYHLFEFSRR